MAFFSKYTSLTVLHNSIVFILTVGFSPPSAIAQVDDLRAQRDGSSDVVSIKTPSIEPNTIGQFFWQQEIRRPGARYIRLRLTNIKSVPHSNSVVSLWDQSGRLVGKYTLSDIVGQETFWTDAVSGSYALVILKAEQDITEAGFTIDRVAFQASAGASLSTVGDDEKQPINSYMNEELIWSKQGPVAKLLLIQDNMPAVCSGFLVGKGELITNHHCIKSQQECDDARIVFGFQENENGILEFGEQYRCMTYEKTRSSFNLDYSLVKVPVKSSRKWGFISIAEISDPIAGQPLFLI